VVSDAIAGGNAQAINYFIAQKYVEAIGKFATSPNAKTILFPVEATQLIGTLGGIGELVGAAAIATGLFTLLFDLGLRAAARLVRALQPASR
jgi:uncharacterized membrane protein YphA (DoxX/SURF4 family)